MEPNKRSADDISSFFSKAPRLALLDVPLAAQPLTVVGPANERVTKNRGACRAAVHAHRLRHGLLRYHALHAGAVGWGARSAGCGADRSRLWLCQSLRTRCGALCR